jgi:hypothetical protein
VRAGAPENTGKEGIAKRRKRTDPGEVAERRESLTLSLSLSLALSGSLAPAHKAGGKVSRVARGTRGEFLSGIATPSLIKVSMVSVD